jgi:hypothetical protein
MFLFLSGFRIGVPEVLGISVCNIEILAVQTQNFQRMLKLGGRNEILM